MSRSTRRMEYGAGESPAGSFGTERVIFEDIPGDSAFAPPADIHETAHGLIVRMELPGVPVGDVQVWVRGSTIAVFGEKRSDPAGAEASFLCLERSFGKFRRVFEVTGCLNLSRVRAVLKGGVLAIVIPKIEERRGQERRVPVTTEDKPE